VHEHGWRIQREPGNIVAWFRPSGNRYRAGPAVNQIDERAGPAAEAS
jgi:hypothetical protein